MVRQKSIMDIRQLEKFLRANIGEYTFEEAFKKTKRIINITVSPLALRKTRWQWKGEKCAKAARQGRFRSASSRFSM